MTNYREFLTKKKGIKQATIEAYMSDIESLHTYLLEKELDMEEADNIALKSYFRHLEKEGRPNSSLSRTMTSINNYYKYLFQMRRREDNPMDGIKRPVVKKSIYQPLTEEEIHTLIEVANSHNLRDGSIISLLYSQDLGLSDILNLTLGDVNLEMNYIKCKKGIVRMVLTHLKRYILEDRPSLVGSHTKYVFLNKNGQKMSRQGFWKYLKFYSQEANVEKIVNIASIKYSYRINNKNVV